MLAEQQYIELFQKYRSEIDSHASSLMNEERAFSFDFFAKKGFPNQRDEDFLHINLEKQFSNDYGMNLKAVDFKVDPYKFFRCTVPGINSHMFFVINDQFYPNVQLKYELPQGVIAGSLREMSKKYPELIRSYYNKLAKNTTDTTVHFNTAFAQDGFFLYVPKGVVVEKTIQLVNMMYGGVDMMANSRNLIVIEEGASAKLLVCGHAMEERLYLANRVTEVFVGKGAKYDHYKLENTNEKMTNVGSLFVSQDQESEVVISEITLQNGLTRNNVVVNLDGEYSSVVLGGMAINDCHQHTDTHTIINHNQPNCSSKELYKYVLDGEATGAFDGRILVKKDAQKTSAHQTNRNICLNKKAKMYTKPHLEIYADDVSCSHGATVGQLDDSAVFYLRSRGISEVEAKMLLMFAFVNDVEELIRVPALQDTIRLLVEKRFRGELNKKCEGCSSHCK